MNIIDSPPPETQQEADAIDRIRMLRWGERNEFAQCPYCYSNSVMHFKNGQTHKCGECRRRFSIKVGSIFEDSRIGLHKWCMAIWLLTNRPEGLTSTALADAIDVTQKTAWSMLNKLRLASRTRSFRNQSKSTG